MSTVSYIIPIPKEAPSANTSLVEIINSYCVVDPLLPNGTTWVVIRDGAILDQFIHPGYGFTYTAQVFENDRPVTLGAYSMNYGTGRLTFLVARQVDAVIRVKVWQVRIINNELAQSVQRSSSFSRDAATGTSTRPAREDHDHGTPANPVPEHSGDPNVHHPRNHNHSGNNEGTALNPEILDVQDTAIIPRKSFGDERGEVYMSDETLKYQSDQDPPVEYIVQKRGDVITGAEHGDRGTNSSARHNYSVIDGTHGSAAHNNGTPNTEAIGTGTDAGASSNVSKADHRHGITAGGTPTTVNAGDAADAGAASGAARGDHQHGVATGTPSTVAVQTNAVGTSTNLARADHLHNISTGTPGDTGSANAAGAATSVARSDHVHRTRVLVENNDTDIGTIYNLNFRNGIAATISGNQANIDQAMWGTGTLANRPDPGNVTTGYTYYVSDLGLALMSDGSNWQPVWNSSHICENFSEEFVKLDWTGSGNPLTLDSGGESIMRLEVGPAAYETSDAVPRTIGTNFMALSNRFLMYVRLRCSIDSASTHANSRAFVGLGDSLGSGINPPTNFIGVEKQQDGWYLTIRSTAGGATVYRSFLASSDGTGYFSFWIERLSANVRIHNGGINTGNDGDLSTNLPTAGCSLLARIANTSDTQSITLDVDRIDLWVAR